MAKYKYATKVDKEKQATVVATDQPVSTKQSLEVARWLKGRMTSRAIHLLEQVLEMKVAVPYKRFNKKIGHKQGIGPGRYPQKTSKLFLKMIKEAQANAGIKGLNQENLIIAAIVVHKGAGNIHYGRQRGREFKNSHIEIVVEESKSAPKVASKKKEQKPAPKQSKPESKPENKIETKPKEKAKENAKAKLEAKPEAKPGAKTVEKPGEKVEATDKTVEKKTETQNQESEKKESPVKEEKTAKPSSEKVEEKKIEEKPASKPAPSQNTQSKKSSETE